MCKKHQYHISLSYRVKSITITLSLKTTDISTRIALSQVSRGISVSLLHSVSCPLYGSSDSLVDDVTTSLHLCSRLDLLASSRCGVHGCAIAERSDGDRNQVRLSLSLSLFHTQYSIYKKDTSPNCSDWEESLDFRIPKRSGDSSYLSSQICFFVSHRLFVSFKSGLIVTPPLLHWGILSWRTTTPLDPKRNRFSWALRIFLVLPLC